MSLYIIGEANFFFHSFILGIIITLAYDGFIILRRVFHHNVIVVSFEDAIYWIACSIGVFRMLYEENNGILRWFAVLGATLGMLVYKKTISKPVVSIMSTIITKIIKITIKIIRIILKPFKTIFSVVFRFFKRISKKIKKITNYLKIRLTKGLKLLKITLCKQNVVKESDVGVPEDRKKR